MSFYSILLSLLLIFIFIIDINNAQFVCTVSTNVKPLATTNNVSPGFGGLSNCFLFHFCFYYFIYIYFIFKCFFSSQVGDLICVE
jgi:hypothetical protein